MLQKAKTHAIPLGNHVTQRKLTETTKNRLALTKTPNFGIFRFILLYIPLYLGVIPPHSAIPACSSIFRYHSCSFCFIPVLFCLIPPHSSIIIPVYSGICRPFRSVPFRSCV